MSDKLCSVPGCSNGGQLSRGWCATHYARWRRHGDLNPPDGRKRIRRIDAPCSVDGCDRVARSLGLCDMHYKRQWRNGDPLVVQHVSRVTGKCRIEECARDAKVRDLCGPHDARERKYGDPLAPTPPRAKKPTKKYRKVSSPGHPLAAADGTVREHRFVLYGKIGAGAHPCYWCGELVEWRTGSEAVRALVADHLDHDKLNNAPENLVPSCNACNGHRLRGARWEPWQPGMPTGRRSRLHDRCRKGHPLTDDNVYVRPDTADRTCLTCIRIRSKEKYAAQTPEQRKVDQARNRQRIPCPVCGETKGRGDMRRHIRRRHGGEAATAAGILVRDITLPPEPEGLW